MRKTIHLIAAARPNFMKIGPLYHELYGAKWATPVFIQVAQHYDDNMSGTFLRAFNLPKPTFKIEMGRGTHAQQTASAMIGYEGICADTRPECVVVAGDVNATLACALTACKLGIKVAHLEAGLRSHDRTMPEEINRVLTDQVSDILWTPSWDADENLKKEGVPVNRIRRVGNIMIDTLEMTRSEWESLSPWKDLGLEQRGFGLITLHRASNVDDPMRLGNLVEQVEAISVEMPLVFPLHPRTRKMLEANSMFNRIANNKNIRLLEPLGYMDFISYLSQSSFVITDSGGVQEESTYLGILCLTVRPNTERPITLTEGTNLLVEPNEILGNLKETRRGTSQIPELWDGQTAKRVVDDLAKELNGG